MAILVIPDLPPSGSPGTSQGFLPGQKQRSQQHSDTALPNMEGFYAATDIVLQVKPEDFSQRNLTYDEGMLKRGLM